MTFHYETDPVLQLIEQMGVLVRQASDLLQVGGEATYALAQQAIGLAMELEPETIGKLSPASFMHLLEMHSFDGRVVELIAEALDVQAEALDGVGEIIDAKVRREQSAAVRSMLDPNRAN